MEQESLGKKQRKRKRNRFQRAIFAKELGFYGKEPAKILKKAEKRAKKGAKGIDKHAPWWYTVEKSVFLSKRMAGRRRKIAVGKAFFYKDISAPFEARTTSCKERCAFL